MQTIFDRIDAEAALKSQEPKPHVLGDGEMQHRPRMSSGCWDELSLSAARGWRGLADTMVLPPRTFPDVGRVLPIHEALQLQLFEVCRASEPSRNTDNGYI